MDNSKVKVVVRCRPLLPREAGTSASSLRVVPGHKQILLGDGKGYSFDHVYDQTCQQADIYDGCVSHLVDGCFNGYNATVLAYGQTGSDKYSGKTYTMGSAPSSKGESGGFEAEGIIPRAVRHIFDLIVSEHATKIVNVKVSFLEIYNEEIRDLLHADVSPRDIALREDSEGRIFFTGAREEVCNSAHDVFRCLERGGLGRTTAETWMNDASSRSHAVFTISIEACETTVPPDESGRNAGMGGKYIQSKLHLVDLAGSERAKKTGAVGLRLKESVGINQGLMSLGKVIRALTAPAQRGGGTGLMVHGQSSGTVAAHVPYRESKLTRFLQDSLGGNSQTVMLACVTPADSSFHETASTLQYASRARMVQNKVVANVTLAPTPEVEEGLVTALRGQLLQAQGDLEQARKNADVARLMLHMRRSLDDSGILDRSIDRGKPVILKDAQWHLVASLVDGIRQCEQRLQEGVADAEAFLELSQGQASAPNVEDTLLQLCELTHTACSSVAALNALHVVDATSDVVKTARAMATAASFSEKVSGAGVADDSQGAAEKDLEIMRLRSELEECKDDLRRDEEIFAEKMKELKKNKKEVKRLTTENVSLKMAAQSAQEALRVEIDRQGNESIPPASGVVQARDSLDRRDIIECAVDQEMSFAVAACEPDLSQLMEDLEILSKEKEDLMLEKEAAEERVRLITTAAESEKHQFLESKSQLQRRLKELEVGMKLKQEVISSLARKQQEASDLAEKYESRVEELQSVMGRLTSEIRRLSEHASPNRKRNEEVAEAKAASSPARSHSSRTRNAELRKSEQEEKKEYYEAQLKEAEDQLEELQHQRAALGSRSSERHSSLAPSRPLAAEGKPPIAAENTIQLRKELDAMRKEYSDLAKLIEVEDSKQKRHLEELTRQVERHRKNASDYQLKIKKLEKLNLQYQQNMDSSQLRKLQERQHLLLAGGSERPVSAASDHSGYLRRFKTSGINTPVKTAGRATRPSSAPLGDSAVNKPAGANTTTWLDARIEELVQMQFRQAEISRFSDQLKELKADRLTLVSDIEAMKRQQQDGTVSINRQLVDVEKKILDINKQIADDRARLEDEHRAPDRGSADEEERAEHELVILTKISESQRAARSYQERQRELKMRLDNGVLSETALSKLNDLQDNLDTLNSEIQFVENRMTSSESVRNGIANPWDTPIHKKSSVTHDTERSKRDELFADLQRMDEATTTRLLLFLTHQMIETKFRLAKEEGNVSQLKHQIEDLSGDRDKLSAALKQINHEFSAKIDAQKTENETKVAFLVQQLRGAESKLKNGAGALSRSGVGSVVMSSSEVLPPSSRAFSLMLDATKTAAAGTINRPSTAGASAAWASVTNRQRASANLDRKIGTSPSSVSGTSVSEISRRMANQRAGQISSSDFDAVQTETCNVISNIHNNITAKKASCGASPVNDAGDMVTKEEQEKLRRKWLAEKQRREQLEKRNMELTRELRNIRKSNL